MPLTVNALKAMFAQETKEIPLIFMEIYHLDLPPADRPIRLVYDSVDHVVGEYTYLRCYFDIDLPSDEGDAPPTCKLQVDNVDRKIVEACRIIQSPATVTFWVALASSEDLKEAGPFEMTLKGVDADALHVRGDLGYENIFNEPVPGDSFTPATHPGLF